MITAFKQLPKTFQKEGSKGVEDEYAFRLLPFYPIELSAISGSEGVEPSTCRLHDNHLQSASLQIIYKDLSVSRTQRYDFGLYRLAMSEKRKGSKA
jgi:hypothetical protein